jgi:ABC-type dipeptide/oligopeptide/nickel transport system permease subunit
VKQPKLGPLFWISAGFLTALVLLATVGTFILPDPLKSMGAPNQMPSGSAWLGTDEQGRDILSRLAHGAQVSLYVGFFTQLIAVAVGIFVGVVGEFGPKWVSSPLMRLTDAMFAFPDLLLAILIVGIFGAGVTPVIIALSVTAWPSVARLVKTQMASLREREYVQAARAQGAGTSYVVFRHILPHLWGILLAVSMVDLAAVILAESSLSFLGIGVQAPQPSWGSMVNSARAQMASFPIQLVWPCLILAMTIFALNFVGDGLRALTDPRSR